MNRHIVILLILLAPLFVHLLFYIFTRQRQTEMQIHQRLRLILNLWIRKGGWSGDLNIKKMCRLLPRLKDPHRQIKVLHLVR